MTGNHFDFLAIGGGSGGIASAVRAASHGARAAVVEHGRLGGTCVNVGCVPKKLMWYAASLGHTVHEYAGYGFDVSREGFSWASLKRVRDAYVQRLNGIYARRLETEGVARYRGTARFVDARAVVVGDTRVSADHVVIATGGMPSVPPTPGAELGITSDGFFELDECPGRVVVSGSGYIAVELAGVLRALGSEVTMVLRRDRVIRAFDEMLSNELMAALSADGIEIRTTAEIERIVRNGRNGHDARRNTLTVRISDGTAIEAVDSVLWAIGRKPNVDSLDLAATGVETTRGGAIVTDEFQRTSVDGVYAIGDVTGRAPLTPVAIAAGRRLADRLFGGEVDRKLSYDCIPSVIFTHPPIGTVGATEAEARAEHGDAVKVYETRFNPMYYAFSEHPRPTAMKLVTLGGDERVIGCHVIGDGADEMMQGFAVAVRMGARKRDLDDTVAIHPTSAEELVTMR